MAVPSPHARVSGGVVSHPSIKSLATGRSCDVREMIGPVWKRTPTRSSS